jgi:hypothetical protein
MTYRGLVCRVPSLASDVSAYQVLPGLAEGRRLR